MKDLKISKELLSEVLKMEVVKHSLLNKSNKSFNVTYMPSEDSLKSSWTPVNIYEFAFKCKEWASKQKKVTLFTVEADIENRDLYVSILYGEEHPNYKMINFRKNNNEIGAIIKACEWILKEQNNDTK